MKLDPVGVDDLEWASQNSAIDDQERANAPKGTADRARDAILKAERAAIRARRSHYGLDRAVGDDAPDGAADPGVTEDLHDTVGLALSGGGIRSATFSLGVLQALAARDVLKRVDYISTVSGGGYIGSSLQWWWSGRSNGRFGVRPDRDGIPRRDRFPYGTDDPSRWRDRAGRLVRPKLLRNLKEKGNYLTPGRGINILSLSAVVLRSAILSMFFWIPLITFFFGLLHNFALFRLAALAAFAVLGVFVAVAVFYSFVTAVPSLRGSAYSTRRWTERKSGWILLIMLVAAFLATIDAVNCMLLGGQSCISLTLSSAAVPRPVAWPSGQIITGWFSALGGLAGGLYTYFRTARAAVSRVQKLPSLHTNIAAILSAGLIVFGVLLFCHGLAAFIVDRYGYSGLSATMAVLLVIGIGVNINHISAHRMYRDRLMEAFMPDFREALLGRSHVAPPKADTMKLNEIDPTKGPYPIINTNVVLVDSKERRRSIRGGDSFALTPIYCGSNATGWVHCDSLMDGRMTLPTAMAISGAAANPNTGAGGVGLTRNRLVSTLMALLGLRLGYWIPSPTGERQPFWLPNHVWPGISAVVPYGHSENDWFLELTDGGHFENLGLYELVRRKARLIIVCDGAQDPGFAFEDLQRAQRRIFADFGARLDLDIAALERLVPAKTDHRFPEGDLKLAEAGHAVGGITYPDGSKALLVYLKTTLVDDLPLALLGYRGANPTFPDQSTSDQFFDEEQFEAYRELGFILAERMLADGKLRSEIKRVFGW